MDLSMLVQVAPRDQAAFSDYQEPHQQITSDEVTLYVTVVEADGLPQSDGAMWLSDDPYVRLGWRGSTNSPFRTRSIEKSHSPVWNEELHLAVPSLTSSILEVKAHYCNPKGTMNSCHIGTVEIKVWDLPRGKIVDNWYDLWSSSANKAYGRLHLRLHLANVGQPSYEEKAWDPYEVHIQLKNKESLAKKMPAGWSGSPFFTVGMLYEWETECGHVSGHEICDCFRKIVTTPSTDKVRMALCEYKFGDRTRWAFGEKTIPTAGLKPDEIHTETYKIGKNEHEIEVSMCLKPLGSPPVFTTMTAPNVMTPTPNEQGYRVFVRFNEITDGKPYLCCAQINPMATPQWRLVFLHGRPSSPPFVFFDVSSLNSECLVIKLYRIDENLAEDVWEKPEYTCEFMVRDLPMGMVMHQSGKVKGGGQVSYTVHLAHASYAPFVDQPFTPMALNIQFIEAVGVPKMDRRSKTDCLFRVRLESDLPRFCRFTRTIDDSLTPQWNEKTTVLLTKPMDKFTIEMCDEDDKKVIPISGAQFSVQEFENGQPVSKWVRLRPAQGIKNGGAANIAIQVAPLGHELDLSGYVIEPIPDEFDDHGEK